MGKILLVLVCLACEGQSRRVHTKPGQSVFGSELKASETKARKQSSGRVAEFGASNALAAMLSAASPASGWHIHSAGHAGFARPAQKRMEIAKDGQKVLATELAASTASMQRLLRTARRPDVAMELSFQDQLAFRALGVEEDSGEAEIQASYDRLRETYADDPEKLQRIELAKRQIGELQQRKKTEDAQEKAQAQREASESGFIGLQKQVIILFFNFLKSAWKAFWRSWTLPGPRHVFQCLVCYVGLPLMCSTYPVQAPFCNFVATLEMPAFMYQHDEPEYRRDKAGFEGEVRQSRARPNIFGHLCALAAWIFACQMTQRVSLIMNNPDEITLPFIKLCILSSVCIWPALFFSSQRTFPETKKKRRVR